MNAETAEFIAYAQGLLGDAAKMLDSGLPDPAARTAYLARFHAARAYTFQRPGQVAKTHKGVQSELYRLSKDNARVDPALRRFPLRAYAYKASAGYETKHEDATTPEDARESVETAGRFVTEFARLTPLSRPTA
jgi:uncharacterized protein (UPF0332 family)